AHGSGRGAQRCQGRLDDVRGQDCLWTSAVRMAAAHLAQGAPLSLSRRILCFGRERTPIRFFELRNLLEESGRDSENSVSSIRNRVALEVKNRVTLKRRTSHSCVVHIHALRNDGGPLAIQLSCVCVAVRIA